MNEWREMTTGRRAAWLAVVLALLGGFAWAAVGLLSPNWQVLFNGLRPQDAATITTELDKQKFKYKLEADGGTILVPEAQVHSARIKVLGKELPLAGGVGFELFNNADLGLTEFAQKVNYQRALQGELARTIMSLDQVASARVHLSLPESGYMRRASAKAKASVTVSTKGGSHLDKTAVRSIQRLVAAAVPELEVGDVIVVDQTLAPAGGADLVASVSDPRLQAKLELEEHYSRRVTALADRLFGTGHAQVSVDLTLNFDQTRVVNESTTAAAQTNRAETAKPAAGNESQLVDNGRAPGETMLPSPETNGRRNTQRRVEETSVAPGAIRRANLGVLVDVPVDMADQERFKALLVAAIGLNPDRGDSISLFSVNGLPASQPGAAASASGMPDTQVNAPTLKGLEPTGATGPRRASSTNSNPLDALGWLLLIVLVPVVVWLLWRQWRRAPEPTSALDETQRVALARRLAELLPAQERT